MLLTPRKRDGLRDGFFAQDVHEHPFALFLSDDDVTIFGSQACSHSSAPVKGRRGGTTV
jgi:hypothetical protein